MDILHLLCVVTVACSGLTHGTGILPEDTMTAALGGTVRFTTNIHPPEKPFIFVGWTLDAGEKNIITSTDVNITGPEYDGRITLFRSTGSLELKNLFLHDSGDYRVNILPSGGAQLTGKTSLQIQESISGVTVTSSDTDLVEFNSSVSLSCSATGTSPSFLWLNGNSEVTDSERVQITDGGRSLTIVNVTRSDEGPFRCHVSNAVSNDTSSPVTFSISYGPDDIQISPTQEHYLIGSEVLLTCSSVSSPPAQFNWFLNENPLPDTGPELKLTNVQEDQSGNYSCQAFNSKTLRYKRSQPLAIKVVVAVSNVTVTSSDTDLVEFNSSVSLSCSSSGSSLSFFWLNGSSEVKSSERVQLTDGGRSLTIVNVTRSDEGPFRCHVFNPVTNGSSDPVNLPISFGPENVILKLSSSQKNFVEGSSITLSCSAVSRPAALFYWFLNESLQSHTGPELRLTNINMSHSGNYSCQAFNSKTLRYQRSQASAVTVQESIPGSGCSAGCIAGIVIACIVIAGACAAGAYCIYKKKKKTKPYSTRDTATRTGVEGQSNAANSQNQELNYADIKFTKNKDGGAVRMEVEDNSIQYAQIQMSKPPAQSTPPTYDAYMERSKRQTLQPPPGNNGATYAQVHKK